jgi:hypothetical protein
MHATTDYAVRAAIVEGYNSNVAVIASGDINGTNPALFTGVDTAVQVKSRNKWNDEMVLEVGGRVRLYAPLADFEPQHDGTAYVRGGGSWALSPRSTFTLIASNTILTLNAAPAGDPTFRGNPFQSRSMQSFGSVAGTLAYEFARAWSFAVTGGSLINFTLDDPTVVTLPDGTTTSRAGLNALQPFAQVLVNHELNDRHGVNVLARYDYSFTPSAIDYTAVPPRSLGVFDVHTATLALGHTYGHPRNGLALGSRAGATLATAPPLDTDRRPLIAPYAGETISFARDDVMLRASATYMYGSPFPRIGAGPGVFGSLEFMRLQSVHGWWSNWSFLTGVVAGYTEGTLAQDVTSKVSTLSGSTEMRRLLVNGLSASLGYGYRRTISSGSATIPEIDQHLVYFGLAYLWATDQRTPALATLVGAPIGQ